MDINKIYGSMVFNDQVMRERLPKPIYNSLKATIQSGSDLQEDIADVVATAMKDWAIEKGASHFTHWFQPMTGTTAEKHESFLNPISDSQVIMEFSGKNLVKGEPDASSFPTGGLRETFEGRGYTSWDPTSPAFIKDGSLYIPSVFYSYKGDVLDKKTPLLRSMEVVNIHAMRILRLFDNHTSQRVLTTMGAEQEYFLIDQDLYNERKDLIITGRTLFGAKPPKGQEFGDHYFSAINERVGAFMKALDEELWRLGVPSKIKHSEVAPCQFELVPIFASSNVASDQNQLVMASMKKIARQHGLVCLLHEKPFVGVNGSGKHNNWSLSTDDGINLLDPGASPQENAQFLLFLCAMVQAVDEYPELIRITVSTAGNDHRLGAHEAPPAILSIFLGEELTNILLKLEEGIQAASYDRGVLEIGVKTLPILPKDTSDRNRTSPFAFTGNKFEFRMPGSALSISGPNIVLNTAVGDVLSRYADRLEEAEDFTLALNLLLAEVVRDHKKVIFNGNNYTQEWRTEAARRGLPNLHNAVEAIPLFVLKKNVNLLTKHRIFTEEEIHSRAEILLGDYARVINIEALTSLEIAKKNILPAVIRYSRVVTEGLHYKEALGLSGRCERHVAEEISRLSGDFVEAISALETCLEKTQSLSAAYEGAKSYRDCVLTKMNELRAVADALEMILPEDTWPMPSYTKILLEL